MSAVGRATTARVSTYQAATSHISTSTQILASRKASGSSRIARNRVFAEATRSWHILLPIIPSGG